MASAAVANTNQIAAAKKPPVDAAQILAKLKTFWASRTSAQKIYFGIGAAVTLASAIFFSRMIATPDMKPLMSGMEAADAQALAKQLSDKKIPYVVSPDGTSISVPADQVDAARMELASKDGPKSGRIGFEIFDKVSWGETEFDEKVNYQRALEGELERTIQTMSNVKNARVHLVMATDSVFIDRERPAKASVTLRLKRGTLTREEGSAITRLVAGAVDDLKPTDVALIDADTNKQISTGSIAPGGDSEVEQDLGRRLMATLSPIVGADGVHATVNVEYDTSSVEEHQDKYDPAGTVPLTMQKSEELASGDSTIGGVPGTSSNLPSQKAAATTSTTSSAAPGQSSKSESATYGVNRVTRHVVQPAGRIRRVTAAVLVDDAVDRHQEKGKWVESHHKRSPEEMKLITDLAQAAIGYDAARGDVVSVQNLGFAKPAEIDLTPPTFVEKTRKGLNDYASIVRYGMLLGMFLLVYALMIRPIQKRVLTVQEAPALPTPAEAEQAFPETAETLALRSLTLKKQLTDFVKNEPETSATAVRAWLRDGNA